MSTRPTAHDWFARGWSPVFSIFAIKARSRPHALEHIRQRCRRWLSQTSPTRCCRSYYRDAACEADTFAEFAESQFGGMQPGFGRVAATYVNGFTDISPTHPARSTATTSAAGCAHQQTRCVPRLRASGHQPVPAPIEIPARYRSVYADAPRSAGFPRRGSSLPCRALKEARGTSSIRPI